MHRPQFSLKAMLWLTAVVAAFFGGAAWHEHFSEPAFTIHRGVAGLGTLGSRSRLDHLLLPDGSEWLRVVYTGTRGTHSCHGPNGEIISIKPSPKTRQSWESVVKQE